MIFYAHHLPTLSKYPNRFYRCLQDHQRIFYPPSPKTTLWRAGQPCLREETPTYITFF